MRIAVILGFGAALALHSQTQVPLNDQEKTIAAELGHLRSLPDAEWTNSVANIARAIQKLPASPGKTVLVGRLSNLVTEGDAGHETLQITASTMADILQTSANPQLAATLAQLVRYEHCNVSLDTPEYHAALAKLDQLDRARQSADFTLKDLSGAEWSLKNLRGKVVLVNFWATWCPPCRKEMPDLELLYERFGARGLVILAISDEDRQKVEPFAAAQNYTYPILLDPGRKVNELFAIQGIPKTFVYDREGRLAAQAIDRRTQHQFLAMLKMAGLE